MIKLSKKNKALKAFTMVELLVAISIIALILTVAIFSFSNTREDSRNNQRVSDIKQIQLALEKYYSDNGSYPNELIFGQPFKDENDKIYINILPTNPSPRNDGDCPDSEYEYIYNSENNTYSINFCISKNLENLGHGEKTAIPSGIKNEPYTPDYIPPIQYTLSISKTGGSADSGIVTSSPAGVDCGASCSYDFDYDVSVVLTASGATFNGWSGGGCSGTGTCTVNMNENKSVSADFGMTEPIVNPWR